MKNLINDMLPAYGGVLYCIVSIHLYRASCSAHQLEALPVQETQREEISLERTKRGTWLTSTVSKVNNGRESRVRPLRTFPPKNAFFDYMYMYMLLILSFSLSSNNYNMFKIVTPSWDYTVFLFTE